jgi:hypothetical protein
MPATAESKQFNVKINTSLKRQLKAKLMLEGRSCAEWLDNAVRQELFAPEQRAKIHTVRDDLADGK